MQVQQEVAAKAGVNAFARRIMVKPAVQAKDTNDLVDLHLWYIVPSMTNVVT